FDGRWEDCPLQVQWSAEGTPVVVLRSAEGVRIRRRQGDALALRDLQRLADALLAVLHSQADQARFLLAYLGLHRWTPEARRIAVQLRFPRRRQTCAGEARR